MEISLKAGKEIPNNARVEFLYFPIFGIRWHINRGYKKKIRFFMSDRGFTGIPPNDATNFQFNSTCETRGSLKKNFEQEIRSLQFSTGFYKTLRI